MKRPYWLTVLLLVFSAAFTALILQYFPAPYVWIMMLWATVSFFPFSFAKKAWTKAFWFNLAVIAFALSSTELYFYEFYFGEEPPRETEYSAVETDTDKTDIGDLFRHQLLGWAPTKGKSFIEKTRFNNTLLYEVKYTIDEHGLRATSPSTNTNRTQSSCLLFFGDSFTFGEGVKDEETTPYRVTEKVNRSYQVYNFAFLGFGPHQMLAQLEHGLVDAAIECTPAIAIYQALPIHVSRAAGLEGWEAGPKYVPGEDGMVLWKGRFEQDESEHFLGKFRAFHRDLSKDLRRVLEKSAVYRALLFMHRAVNDDDLDVFFRIVVRSNQLVESRYPGARFHVVFWDFSREDRLESKIILGLKQKGIPVHLISSILPEYRGHEEKYKIHPADGHPNPLAHDLVADYIVKTILTPSIVARN
ncbi:MAG TPA: hypothetical protein VJL88_16480 [Nitrospira sp.]|nr:hypothetical protein [Nitrospira sp.]